MCGHCSTLKLVDRFKTPEDYEDAIGYIESLVKERSFVLVEGNCKLGCHKNGQGRWVDDIVYHVISQQLSHDRGQG